MQTDRNEQQRRRYQVRLRESVGFGIVGRNIGVVWFMPGRGVYLHRKALALVASFFVRAKTVFAPSFLNGKEVGHGSLFYTHRSHRRLGRTAV